MLVLSRRLNEKILLPSIGGSVEVLEIRHDRVRLGIAAPAGVPILREELAARQGNRPETMVAPADLNLARQQRHQLRNHLNTTTVAVALARRQLQAGMLDEVETTLVRLAGGMQQINSGIEQLSAPAAPRALPRALVVEDDSNECELLAGFFRMAGYQVATAHDGTDALDYLQDHERPDVLLLDMMLPRCDGPTTIRHVRDNPQWDGLKIFAMSGYTPDQVGLDCRAAGVSRWFQKPLNPELVLKEMNAVRCETATAC